MSAGVINIGGVKIGVAVMKMPRLAIFITMAKASLMKS
jgi:hypothetical protein